MRTDDLIDALSRELTPAPRSVLAGRVALAVGIGTLAALVILRFTLGFRPDIGVAAPVVAAKAAFSALIATVALGLAMKAARPGAGAGAAVAAVALLVGALGVAAVSLAATDSAHRWEAWTADGFPWCVALIPLLGTPAAGLLVWALREAAPTRLALAGAAIGALSGGIGAGVYAMVCPVDSVPFVATWYVAGVAVSAALGGLLGSRLLRW